MTLKGGGLGLTGKFDILPIGKIDTINQEFGQLIICSQHSNPLQKQNKTK